MPLSALIRPVQRSALSSLRTAQRPLGVYSTRLLSTQPSFAPDKPEVDYEERGRELTLLQRLATKSQDKSLYSEVVDGWRDLHGPRHPYTLQAMSSFSQLLQEQGELEKAEPPHARSRRPREPSSARCTRTRSSQCRTSRSF